MNYLNFSICSSLSFFFWVFYSKVFMTCSFNFYFFSFYNDFLIYSSIWAFYFFFSFSCCLIWSIFDLNLFCSWFNLRIFSLAYFVLGWLGAKYLALNYGISGINSVNLTLAMAASTLSSCMLSLSIFPWSISAKSSFSFSSVILMIRFFKMESPCTWFCQYCSRNPASSSAVLNQ